MTHLVSSSDCLVDFRMQNAITRPDAVPIVTQLNTTHTTQQRIWNHSESSEIKSGGPYVSGAGSESLLQHCSVCPDRQTPVFWNKVWHSPGRRFANDAVMSSSVDPTNCYQTVYRKPPTSSTWAGITQVESV